MYSMSYVRGTPAVRTAAWQACEEARGGLLPGGAAPTRHAPSPAKAGLDGVSPHRVTLSWQLFAPGYKPVCVILHVRISKGARDTRREALHNENIES